LCGIRGMARYASGCVEAHESDVCKGVGVSVCRCVGVSVCVFVSVCFLSVCCALFKARVVGSAIFVIKLAVSVPERSKGVDSSSTVFALVGSNPTADNLCLLSRLPRLLRLDWEEGGWEGLFRVPHKLHTTRFRDEKDPSASPRRTSSVPRGYDGSASTPITFDRLRVWMCSDPPRGTRKKRGKERISEPN